jgi:hypothetical protein
MTRMYTCALRLLERSTRVVRAYAREAATKRDRKGGGEGGPR